jgi:putative DNA-invertase from lambdoid prophage Rac
VKPLKISVVMPVYNEVDYTDEIIRRVMASVAMQAKEIGSGAAQREARENLLKAARRREIDGVLVWRLDRWGRSVTDLLTTLQELEHLGVGFVSLTEALDLTTPAGRAMAGLLAVFAEFEREILRERVRAGLAHARQNGKHLGRPATAALHADRVRKLRRPDSAKSASPAACASDAPRCGVSYNPRESNPDHEDHPDAARDLSDQGNSAGDATADLAAVARAFGVDAGTAAFCSASSHGLGRFPPA